MSAPHRTLSLISQDAAFVRSVVEWVEARPDVSLEVIEDLAGAEKRLAESRPSWIVADFLHAESGGHEEARVLEWIGAHLPQARLLVVASDTCPEPIVRACAVSSIEIRPQLPLICALEEWLFGESANDRAESVETTAASESSGASSDEVDASKRSAEADESSAGSMTARFRTRTFRVRQMLSELEVAARHDVTILLIGETGSGKTHLSRLIHEASPRRDEPFLVVPCGALPRELIESELFGHVKGAFTSAHADKEGKFVAAGRGTILLDEIDVLGPEQQVKLLRVIETGEFEPVGSNQTLRSQARLVVASNLDLQPLVEQGRFRPDLYYRLNMLKFEIPPLRKRIPDIEPLARQFVRQHAQRYGVNIERIDSGLFRALERYPWPGNVRELENVLRRAVIYCRDGILTADQLPAHVLEGVAGPANDPSVTLGRNPTPRGRLGEHIALTERELIEQALLNNNHSRIKTARELGISRVTLYNKMKKYGIAD